MADKRNMSWIICNTLLFGLIWHLTEVDSNACNETTFEVNSTEQFIQVVEEVQILSSQKSCYVILLRQNRILLNLSETLNISVNLTLLGTGATITCIHSPSVFHHPALIMVKNSQYFGIDGVTFLDCPSSLRFENVSSISITESHFRGFTQVPVHLFNCPLVSIVNSTFVNNTSTARYLFRSFEANAAGVSFGWNNLLLDNQPAIDIYVYNCSFVNNIARGVVRDFDPTTDALETRTFAGRGGGMAVVLNSTSFVTVIVERTKFIGNHANGFGGGFYLLIDGISLNQYFNINKNTFENNTATFGGAAINVGYLSIIPNSTINRVIIQDSNFINNQAGLVGAIGLALTYTFGMTNFIKIINCNFQLNHAGQYGAAIGLFHLDFLSAKTNVQPVEVTNCKFVNNVCENGGILGVGYFPVILKGNVTFINSTGPAFRVVASVVHVKGAHLTFMGNNAQGLAGGAMYLTSYTQVILSQGSSFDFLNNTGSIGASVVVETQAVPQLFSKTAFNQLCFLQFDQAMQQNIKLPPEEWKEVTFNFMNNVAIVGSAFYIDRISHCSWNSYLYPYFSLDNTLKWSFIHYGSSNNNTGHEKSSDSVIFDLQTPPAYFTLGSKQVSSYPGQVAPISLKAYDELNHTSAALFEIGLNESKGDVLQFFPSAYLFEPSDNVLEVRYSLKRASETGGSVLGIRVSAYTVNETSKEKLELLIKPCQPGYRLQNSRSMRDSYSCQCDDDVLIKDCEGDNIILQNGLWGHYTGNELIFYHCPAGYCRCHTGDCLSVYTTGNESLQCICDRHGFLCGRCTHGKGVSTLLNTCQSCISVGWLLIIVLVFVNVLVTLIVVIRDIKFSSWMFPFTYYIQTVPYILQNQSFAYSTWNNYLYYLNSILSLYFPYDFCLFHESDAVLSYGLRYIPIVVTSIVWLTLFILYKRCAITKWRYSWNGVWTLILLQYSHVVHTSISILNCPAIPEHNGDNTNKWYVDANIQCFQGTHAVIGSIAIVFLIVTILLVPFVGALGCELLFKGQKVWKKISTALLTNSPNPQYKWWSSIELARRFLIISIVLPLPGNEVPPLLMSIVIFTFYAYFLPTEDNRYSFTVVFETVILGQIIIMLSLKSTSYIQDTLQQMLDSTVGDSCQSNQVLTELTLLLLVLYYIPILIVLIYLIFIITKWSKCLEWIKIKRMTKRSFSTQNLLDPFQSTVVRSSYIAVEDDGTVTLSHKRLS